MISENNNSTALKQLHGRISHNHTRHEQHDFKLSSAHSIWYSHLSTWINPAIKKILTLFDPFSWPTLMGVLAPESIFVTSWKYVNSFDKVCGVCRETVLTSTIVRDFFMRLLEICAERKGVYWVAWPITNGLRVWHSWSLLTKQRVHRFTKTFLYKLYEGH